jgi:hypothetical protein
MSLWIVITLVLVLVVALALRERPVVRALRLGGTAALPTYFEIAERAEVSLPEVESR